MQVLKDSPFNIYKNTWRIECISIYSKGFIIGSKDATVIVYKATNNEKAPFEETYKVSFGQITEIKDNYIAGISIAPHSEDRIICSLSNNCIY